MTVPVFATVRAKLSRAEEHLKALNREIAAWHNLKPYRVASHRNEEGTRHSLIVTLLAPFPATRLSLIAGDALHSMRSALDHLIYSIAVHESKSAPPPGYRRLQFPIADDDQRFDVAVSKGWLNSLSDRTITTIKSLQPHHRNHPALPPLLALLRDFDDADKHRLLNVVSSAQAQADLLHALKIHPGEKVTIDFREGQIEDGTEALVVTLEIPQPNMRLNAALKFAVAIEHPPGPSGAPQNGLWAVLCLIRDEVNVVIERVTETIFDKGVI